MWLRYEATTLQIPTFHVAFSLDLAGLVKKQLDYLRTYSFAQAVSACIGIKLIQTLFNLFTQMHPLVVIQTGLLVYEDCHFHHERKDMQLEKIPKWKMEDQEKCIPYMCSRTLNIMEAYFFQGLALVFA